MAVFTPTTLTVSHYHDKESSNSKQNCVLTNYKWLFARVVRYSAEGLLHVSHLDEQAPDPRSSSLPWGRRSQTPEPWAETAVALSLSSAARAAGWGVGPAPLLLPKNGDGSGERTDPINNQLPSVTTDIWKVSTTHLVSYLEDVSSLL